MHRTLSTPHPPYAHDPLTHQRLSSPQMWTASLLENPAPHTPQFIHRIDGDGGRAYIPDPSFILPPPFFEWVGRWGKNVYFVYSMYFQVGQVICLQGDENGFLRGKKDTNITMVCGPLKLKHVIKPYSLVFHFFQCRQFKWYVVFPLRWVTMKKMLETLPSTEACHQSSPVMVFSSDRLFFC